VTSVERPEIAVARVETGEQLRTAGDAIARGFQDNEVWAWLLPNERTRARVERRQYRALVRHVFLPRRSAWVTEAGTGGALWFPPGTKPLSFVENLAEIVPFLPEGLPSLGKARKLDRMIRSRQPRDPHWYLATLAVEPESRGLGHGSALIRPGLALADRSGSGVWLETQRESNIGFYERFGFELIERFEVESGLPLWTMKRDPQPG
jgi:ribosomal protein S18 acetylase RimI-like enzyme